MEGFVLDEVGFFEGTEKLLEIWFEDDCRNTNCYGDLRRIPRHKLDELLTIVSAEIVSVKSNDYIDSYVLSESSMFISKERFIIKTCGIIKLLESVPVIIQLAKEYGKKPKIQNFFYSRRVYLRPEEQQGIHQCFDAEVKYLKNFIPTGSSYTMGQSEEEQWYLFTMDNNSGGPPVEDATLEILMSNLDEKTMLEFTKVKNADSEEVLRNTGISRIIPGSINDGLVFDPIGFSLNGLYKDSYYTIHVTPQPMCSYVSFETNLRQKDYSRLIKYVLNIFKPGKLIVTLFTNTVGNVKGAGRMIDRGSIPGYRCDDTNYEQLKNYSLAYRHYVKK